MQQAGFTLMESLVVLVIVGLVGSALTLDIRSRLPGLRLDTAASAAEEELRALQAEALMQGQETEFSLATLTHRNKNPARRRLARIAVVDVRIQGGEPGHPDQLRFLPGGWSPGGKLLLRDGDRQMVVRVEWPLGLVHMEQR